MNSIADARLDSKNAGEQAPMLRWELLLLLIILGIGLFLRWYSLDTRALHHDESLHVMYGIYYYDRPETGFYRYDPMLHGPLLYNLLPHFYALFGDDPFTGRILSAFLGSCLIFAPLLFRRYLTSTTLLLLTAVLSFSPMLVYWSRFLRHDGLVLFGMLAMAIGAFLARSDYKILLVSLGMLVQFVTKENAYVTTAILLGYLIFEAVFPRGREFADSHVASAFRYCKERRWQFVLACSIVALIYVYLFTGGFRFFGNMEGPWWERSFGAVLDGLYRKSIAYWASHHEMERIKGPFLFHFYMMSWYELPFVMVLFYYLFDFYRRASRRVKTLGFEFLLVLLILLVVDQAYPLKDTPIGTFLKAKDSKDFFGALLLLFHSVLITSMHLIRKERALAFFGYWFFAQFFTYCFLGEKVPWLSVYPFIAGCVYFALYFQRYPRLEHADSDGLSVLLRIVGGAATLLGVIFVLEGSGTIRLPLFLTALGIVLTLLSWVRPAVPKGYAVSPSMCLAIIALLFMLRTSILVNFTKEGSAEELISQVHTTQDFHSLVMRIRNEELGSFPGETRKIYGEKDSVWPLTSYLVGIKSYRYYAEEEELGDFDYLFVNGADRLPEEVAKEYHIERVELRGWWVPEYSMMGLRQFLGYAVHHKPWNKPGFSYVHFYRKKRSAAPLPETPEPETGSPAP